jgi:hypothetical protein
MLNAKSLTVIALCTAPLWCACRSTATAADKTPGAPAPMDARETWVAYVRLATPTEHHRALEPMIGRFKLESRSWTGPDSDPEEMRGTMENRWILGGRFLQGTLEGRMSGMPYEGLLTLGFDNAKQRYVAGWIDNMGTNMTPVMEGSADASGRVITLAGTMDDPVKMKTLSIRERWTIKSRDEHEFEMWASEGGGAEFKMLEIACTRM